MDKLQLEIENTFTGSTKNNKELGHTVYDRVFHKLLSHGGPLGKVHPIYFKTELLEKTFGILTLNQSGSYSLFLELPGDTGFDHLTFNKDLNKDTHHYTTTGENGNKKVLPISATRLSNDTLHAATIVIKDYSLLKEIPKKIIYPSVPLSEKHRIEDAFLTSGSPEGSSILQIQGTGTTICVQIFLVPKNTDYKSMTIFPQPYQQIQKDFDLGVITYTQCSIIPHEGNNEYSLGIVAFLYSKPIDPPLFILTNAKQQGFYSKLDIKKYSR